MNAIFSWLSLLASFANLFAVASGQPKEPPPIGKISGAEVRSTRLYTFFEPLSAILNRCLKHINKFKQIIQVQDLGTAAGFGASIDIRPVRKLPIKPKTDLEAGKLIAEFEQIPSFFPPKNIEIAKGSLLDDDLKTAR